MPRAFDRCVEAVRGTTRNPFAVCNASGAGKTKPRQPRGPRKRRRGRRQAR